MPLTTDKNHPDLNTAEGPGLQNKVYLVLSEEERAKGFIRPLRRTYIHSRMKDGSPMPKVLLNEHLKLLEGCGVATTMGQALAETYARDPYFYGRTWCCGCLGHYPVDEFDWEDGEQVGS